MATNRGKAYNGSYDIEGSSPSTSTSLERKICALPRQVFGSPYNWRWDQYSRNLVDGILTNIEVEYHLKDLINDPQTLAFFIIMETPACECLVSDIEWVRECRKYLVEKGYH